MKTLLLSASIALALGFSALPEAAFAQASEVRYVVNDTPITSYDIQRRAAFLQLQRRGGGQAPAEGRQRVIVIQVMYSLAGLVGSLAFYDSDVRSRIEGLSLGYDVQELVIGFVFALLISLLPLGVILMAGQGAGKSRPWTLTALGYALLPSFLVAAAVSFAFFVERPVAELEQLRGFLAGLMLRTGMYIAASL